MNILSLLTGGRPVTYDDFQILQELSQKSVASILRDKGAFVVSGCTVAGGNIAAGYVFIDGELAEFPGATGVTFPVYLKLGDWVGDVEKAYLTDGTKETQKYREIEVATSVPGSGEYITFTSGGPNKTYTGVMAPLIIASLADGSITNAKLATGIDGAKISNATITKDAIALGTINAARIQDLEITEPKIGNGVVSTAKLADSSVTNAKLAGGITGDKLVNATITKDQIAPGTINGARIQDLEITETKIGNGSVTEAKLGNAAVTVGKLGTDVLKAIGGDGDSYGGSLALNSYTTTSSRVYSSYRLQAVLTDATYRRHYVKFQITANKSSGSILTLAIERSTTGSFSGEQTTIKDITLEIDTTQQLIIDMVDAGFNTANVMTYYQLRVTVASGNAILSNNAHALMFSVPYGF